MTSMSYSTCGGSSGYVDTGHSTDTSKSTSPHISGSPCYPPYTTTPGITDTGTIRTSPYPLTPYLFPGRSRMSETASHSKPATPILSASYAPYSMYSEPAGTGLYKSTSPLHFTSPYPGFSSRSEYESGYSRDYGRYPSYRPKSNSSTRPSNTESYLSVYSPSTSDNRATLSVNNMNASQLPFTSSLSMTNCNSVIQCASSNTYEDNNSRITSDDNGNDSILSPRNEDQDGVITAIPQQNDVIISAHNRETETILPDYNNGNDSIHHNTESSTCKSNEIISNAMNAILEDGSSNESEDLHSRKKKPTGVSKLLNNKKHRKSSYQNSESEPADLRTSEPISRRSKVISIESTEKPHTIPRPPYSYVALIRKAILSSPEKRLTLQEIYKYILQNFEFFKYCEASWKNSIRHNLSLNKCFYRIPREGGGEKKGGFWLFDSKHEHEFQNNNWRRRVRMKRPSKGQSNTPCTSASSMTSTFSPTFSRPYHPHPYPHQYLNYPTDLISRSYRSMGSSDRNWSLGHMSSAMRHSGRSSISSYSPCQRMQAQALHVGYMQSSQIDAIATTTAQASISLSHSYSSESYVPPPAAFPDHYPAQCIRESTWSSQQNQRYRSY